MASNSAAPTTGKRAHKTLTIDQKIELLDKVGHTSYTVLCEEYGIGHLTITDLRKKETELRQYRRKMTEMGVNRQAKIMKLGQDEQLDSAVFLWFRQKREEGIPITGTCTVTVN